MDLNLEEAFDAPVALSQSFEIPTEKVGRPELLSLEPVAFTGILQRVDPGFSLTGSIRIGGTVACSRCLAPVSFSRSGEASWVFAPAHRRPGEDELELSAGDLDIVYYDELTIPLDPLIEEELQLALPMKALCREDCRGLCPSCGVDRNQAACACEPPVDSRLAGLKLLIARKP